MIENSGPREILKGVKGVGMGTKTTAANIMSITNGGIWADYFRMN